MKSRFGIRTVFLTILLFGIASSIYRTMSQRDRLFTFVTESGGKLYAEQELTGYPFATELKYSARVSERKELAIDFCEKHCWDSSLSSEVLLSLVPLSDSLKHLKLTRTGLSDYSVLQRFSNLKTLHIWLSESDSPNPDFSALASLSRLGDLEIYTDVLNRNSIVHFTSFADLPCLTKLNISRPDQETLDAMFEVKQLTCLEVDCSYQTSQLDFRSGPVCFESLTDLEITADNLDFKVDWVLKFAKLRRLVLSGPTISDFKKLGNLEFITRIQIDEQVVSVEDFMAIKDFSKLVSCRTKHWEANRTSESSDWSVRHRGSPPTK